MQVNNFFNLDFEEIEKTVWEDTRNRPALPIGSKPAEDIAVWVVPQREAFHIFRLVTVGHHFLWIEMTANVSMLPEIKYFSR